MKAIATCLVTALLVGGAGLGCKSSHEEGVKSNLYSQWEEVNADVKTTTNAAQSVLEDEDIKDVMADSTNIDGKATGKLADGKKVELTVKRLSDSRSQVQANVGKLGSPKYGAELVAKVKAKAEGYKK